MEHAAVANVGAEASVVGDVRAVHLEGAIQRHRR